MFFQQQVVRSGDVIVFIRFDTSLGILNIKVKLFKFFQNDPIDRNTMKSHHYTAI